ncbi:GAF domain-containing protein [Alicyclobacillus sp. ALC3]|uniref:GAF domain-containing protein n=1 Tax=Alicyclobacillus sp. ALC3 TaxID=2796143 RepID=UPI0027A4B1F4|nr:GAF domain-containing protein [Alicyclobacillus sp. ALC3]
MEKGGGSVFETTRIDESNKTAFYESVAQETRHLLAGEPDVIANLSNLSALLNLHLGDINWVGFYLWHRAEQELVLGPFQGKPACIRIGLGKGVCGTAAQTRATQVVADVFAFPGHIACDAASRSEVVVPIVQAGELIGVLDIDSPLPGRFDNGDAQGLELVVRALTDSVQFGI